MSVTRDDQTNLRYWLALLRTPGIGPARFMALLEYFDDDIQAIFTPAMQNLLAKWRVNIQKPDWKAVDRDLAWLSASSQHHIITLKDKDYPKLLLQTVNPPPVLFVNGELALLSQLQLAIVGSRNPTPAGIAITTDFARELSIAGLIITSGMALGIDAAAHRGALKANGKTIAVLGTGINTIYPKQHQELALEIAQQGALVSEFPTGIPPIKENFPRRNRVVSGMSSGTLVTEASLNSGSLITARFACEQNREVFAIPGSINNPLSRGCHALIKQGAKITETALDILDELALSPQKSPPLPVKPQTKSRQPVSGQLSLATFQPAPVDETHLKLLECVGYEITAIDKIVELCGYTVTQVASMLLTLELTGYIAAAPGGYLRVTS